MRVSLRILIGLVLALLVAQTWLVLGLVTPLVVSGGSMAPGLVGEHYQVICGECGRSFACDQQSTPAVPRPLSEMRRLVRFETRRFAAGRTIARRPHGIFARRAKSLGNGRLLAAWKRPRRRASNALSAC